METTEAIKFYPLGDSALLVQWANTIDRAISQQVNSLAKAVKKNAFVGFVDAAPAYCSLTILYDICLVKNHSANNKTAFDNVKEQIEFLLNNEVESAEEKLQLIEIPVCYDEILGNDLLVVGEYLKLAADEIISMHSKTAYYVYMQGFVPGFAYMGELDRQLTMPRKNAPVAVKAGAVGIAGRQTGIYPVDSPGGWHILGYTPFKMFDAKNERPCLLQAGSMVQFKPIGVDEFYTLKNQQNQ